VTQERKEQLDRDGYGITEEEWDEGWHFCTSNPDGTLPLSLRSDEKCKCDEW
jgi:hypothetical protein